MTEASETTEAQFIEQCENDYRVAELWALAHEAPGAPGLRLLLLVVELLPPWLESDPNIGRGPNEGYPRSIDLGTTIGKLRIQRWLLPIREAISRYRGCLDGSLVVPGYSKKGPAPDVRVPIPPLLEDPTWPHFAVEREPFWESGIPFWGNRPGGSRWHRFLPRDPLDIQSILSDTAINEARRLLREDLPLDFFSRSVLFGSCHLLLPNPVYTDTECRVRDDWHSLDLALSAAPGRTTEGLEAIVWARRAWGDTSVVRTSIASGRAIINLPEGVELTAHAIVCPKRGLLERTSEAPFLASIGIGMHAISEERQVTVPARSSKRPAHTFTVGVSGPPHETMAGTPRASRAAQSLFRDEHNLAARAVWKSLEIKWFDKDIEGGQTAIRDLLGKARQSVDFLDPYFGAADLLSFPLATSLRSIPIRILTSADYCADPHTAEPVDNGDVLLRALEHIRTKDPHARIDIKVMPGAKSPVHDRFLIVDGWIWVLGASLNEFGERGTLLLRLPREPFKEIGDPDWLSISRDVFEAHWSRPADVVLSLAAFVSRRAEERRQVPVAARVTQTLDRLRSTYRQLRRLWRA